MNIKLNATTSIDLAKLIESRMLIQANSGGGKSHTTRRIIEQVMALSKHPQVIVLDPEGEYSNLRSEFDFVYIGKEGDAPAEPRSAALLAKRLLELKASAIIDLYELSPQDRKHFVRLFCEAMVNAPKELWHDALVIIDEAHVFAPENGESESTGPVIDLATRGRKRGYCVILATQRLSKLHKDAAAECNNKLVGRTTLDIDRKRASEELGFSTKGDVRSLRDLDPGEFYVFGPAISRDVERIVVGPLSVQPPKRGVSRAKPPAPSVKVKAILAQLKDLPQEAQKEVDTIRGLQIALRAAEGALRIEKQRKVDLGKTIIDLDAIDAGIAKGLAARDRAHLAFKNKLYVAFLKTHGRMSKDLQQMLDEMSELRKEATDGVIEKLFVLPAHDIRKDMAPLPQKYYIPDAPEMTRVLNNPEEYLQATLGGGELRLLKILVDRQPMNMTRTQLALFAGIKSTTGTFKNYLSKLRVSGMVIEQDGLLRPTEDAVMKYASEESSAPQTFDEMVALWDKVLPSGPRKIFKVICDYHGNPIMREDIAAKLGVSHTTGTFKNYLSILRTNGLIKETSEGIHLSDEISQ